MNGLITTNCNSSERRMKKTFQTLTSPSYRKSFDSMFTNQNIYDIKSGMMSSYNIMNSNGYQSYIRLNSTDTISLLHPHLSIKSIGVNQIHIPIRIQSSCSDPCNRCFLLAILVTNLH